jgi:TRAP-type C4-dicarboxylate transport system permease small subunit
MNVRKTIRKILRAGIVLSTLGLILSVLIQIYGRFFLAASPPWTEEASRLFFIYTVAFGAAPALEDGYFVFLDLLRDRLSAVWAKRLGFIVNLSIIVLCGAMAAYSLKFIIMGYAERSPGMHIRMAFAFFSMFLLFASLAVLPLLSEIKNLRKTQG